MGEGRWRFVLALLAAALPWAAVGTLRAADADYVVIVSASNPATSLKKGDVASMFLKRTSRWPSGKDVQPVDQSVRAPVRAAFTQDVLKSAGLTKLSSVEAYWLQQVFSGRGSPPPVKASDSDVVAYVAANPGAIAYVSRGADIGGVKTVTLND